MAAWEWLPERHRPRSFRPPLHGHPGAGLPGGEVTQRLVARPAQCFPGLEVAGVGGGTGPRNLRHRHPRSTLGSRERSGTIVARLARMSAPRLAGGEAPANVRSARIPVSTYRIQLNRAFGFGAARRLVSYLHELGITDCYTSPYLKAQPESAHGYDICDHNALNPAIGTDAEYNAFVAALRQRGMGQILDVVPNHMGIDANTNPWWRDVLENGPASRYAAYFDVDWQPLKPEMANKVLLPILGDQYGSVLESGALRLELRDGAFELRHDEQRLPLSPRSYARILRGPCERLAAGLGEADPRVLELQSILTSIGYLPPPDETDPALLDERNREKEMIKRRLGQLADSAPEFRAMLESELARLNGTAGDPASFDALDELLGEQAYRLSFWRVAAEEINYRRFFDINDLAAIRMEDPEVFCETHRLIFRLVGEGKVTGLRIDHPDGLRDPAQYLRRRQDEVLGVSLYSGAPRSPLYGDTPNTLPLYVVVEKILTQDEQLPESWPVHGTTGYEFLNSVCGLFIDAANRKAFDDLYRRFVGRHLDFQELAYQSKRLIMRVSVASEINVLANQLSRLAQRDRRSRDFTLNSLREAVREVIACFPIYRTYIAPPPSPPSLGGMAAGHAVASDRDRAYVELAVAWAIRRNPATEPSVYHFLRDILLLGDREPGDTINMAGPPPSALDFVAKFQQATGPVMAKAVEDTSFYTYNRLVALNEVGGDPEPFGVSVPAFHRANLQRLERWPHSLLATSTHDTKRSEDVRARIAVLSELPREWSGAINRWARTNRRWKRSVDGQLAPSRNDEYLLYQTLLGAWPFVGDRGWGIGDREQFVERIQEYMAKATKEAKAHTSWINPNEGYDAAVQEFVRAVLDGERNAAFLADFGKLQRVIAHFGALNSLAQTLLRLTVPGVPDTYQGTELWDLSLVDPDNRRPVDYGSRRRLLWELRDVTKGSVGAGSPRSRFLRSAGTGAEGGETPPLRDLARSLYDAREDGRIKLYLTWRALTFRRGHADLFQRGNYVPVDVEGRFADHVCAFVRELEHQRIVVAVPRLLTRVATSGADPLGAIWADTRLVVPAGPGRYRHLFTDEILEARTAGDGATTLPLFAIFGHFPVALLTLESP